MYAIFAASGRRFYSRLQMKPITHELGNRDIDIIPFADFHLGDLHADWQVIKDLIERVKTEPNTYCILDGDMMDCAVKQSIGDIYGATLQPMEQLKQCVKIFEPIKDKILAVLPGNHEHRIYKQDGIDMTELMCHQLGIVDRYSPTTALVFISSGEDSHRRRPWCYTLYVTHGSGGGRKEGGKINRLADYATIVDADCYICAHTHLPAMFKTCYYRVSYQNRSTSKVEKVFVNTASSLDYGGYGDTQGYKPASNSYPTIHLRSNKKRVTVTL